MLFILLCGCPTEGQDKLWCEESKEQGGVPVFIYVCFGTMMANFFSLYKRIFPHSHLAS
jgi:hypothetical protein